MTFAGTATALCAVGAVLDLSGVPFAASAGFPAMSILSSAILSLWVGSKQYARAFFEIRGEVWPEEETGPHD